MNLLFYNDYAVLNSYDFADRLNAVRVTASDRLASLDVESLFTKVPVEQTLQIVKERLNKLRSTEDGLEDLSALTSLKPHAFMSLLCLVVHDFYFCFAKKLYRLKAGLPMGNRLSPVLANIFMEEIEINVLSNFQVEQKLYTRFVDDLFFIYDCTVFSLQDFLDLFNDQHSAIHLTSELENEHQLPYLDLLVQRVDPEAGQIHSPLNLSIYRKGMHSHKYVHWKSSNPRSLKWNVFRGLWLRGQRLLKNHPAIRNREERYLFNTFANGRNGYPWYLLRRWLANFERELQEKPDLLNFQKRERNFENLD